MRLRIAVVQNGDYLDAKRRMDAGEKEFYFGVRHSIDSLQKLFQDQHHLVISLNALEGHTTDGLGQYVGVPKPFLPSFVPQRISAHVWAQRIKRRLVQFKPTHVLLRTGGLLGLRIVQHCLAARIPMLVVLANSVEDLNSFNRNVNRKFVELMNDPLIDRVGNYKIVAARSLIEYGLKPEKAVAFEFPGSRRPHDFPVKSRSATDLIKLCFAGRMTVNKGCLDVVDAAERIIDAGHQVEMTLIGDGPALAEAQSRAAKIKGGFIKFTGWVENDTMFKHLLSCDIATVPTHHDFPEGLPMSLTEALASRSPVVVSDHTVFKQSFKDEEGVCFFSAGNAQELADVILTLAVDEPRYRSLSETTLNAFQRVSCPTSFGDILLSWRKNISG